MTDHTLVISTNDRINCSLKQIVVKGHIGSVVSLLIKQVAQGFIRHGTLCTQQTIHFKNLFWLSKLESYLFILTDINEKVGLQRIDRFISRIVTLLFQAE